MQPSRVTIQFCHVVTNDTTDVTENTIDTVYNIVSRNSACLEFIIAQLFRASFIRTVD